MPNPTIIADLEARWRPLSDLEKVNAQALLDDAWALLVGRRLDLEVDIAEDKVSTENVVRVVAAMVLRVMRNPDGFTSESLDDYTYRRDAVIASGVLHVTPEELGDLTPARKGRRHSVRLVVYGDQ